MQAVGHGDNHERRQRYGSQQDTHGKPSPARTATRGTIRDDQAPHGYQETNWDYKLGQISPPDRLRPGSDRQCRNRGQHRRNHD